MAAFGEVRVVKSCTPGTGSRRAPGHRRVVFSPDCKNSRHRGAASIAAPGAALMCRWPITLLKFITSRLQAGLIRGRMTGRNTGVPTHWGALADGSPPVSITPSLAVLAESAAVPQGGEVARQPGGPRRPGQQSSALRTSSPSVRPPATLPLDANASIRLREVGKAGGRSARAVDIPVCSVGGGPGAPSHGRSVEFPLCGTWNSVWR